MSVTGDISARRTAPPFKSLCRKNRHWVASGPRGGIPSPTTKIVLTVQGNTDAKTVCQVWGGKSRTLRLGRTSTPSSRCGARSNRPCAATLRVRKRNCFRRPRPPFSPFPAPIAKASFLAPDTLHNKWKWSSLRWNSAVPAFFRAGIELAGFRDAAIDGFDGTGPRDGTPAIWLHNGSGARVAGARAARGPLLKYEAVTNLTRDSSAVTKRSVHID